MSEWWSYRLSDFLLFSPHTYYRLIELYNGELWPAHVVLFAIGFLLFALVRRPGGRTGRIIAGILAAAWLWVGIGFEWRQFAEINWFAKYVAAGFVLQGVLLIWVGVIKGRLGSGQVGRVRAAVGIGLIALGVVGYPALDLALGRGAAGAGLFGLMPDPTAAATLGVLVLSREKLCWALVPLPLLSSLLSSAILSAMEQPDWWVPLLGAGIGSASSFPNRHRTQELTLSTRREGHSDSRDAEG